MKFKRHLVAACVTLAIGTVVPGYAALRVIEKNPTAASETPSTSAVATPAAASGIAVGSVSADAEIVRLRADLARVKADLAVAQSLEKDHPKACAEMRHTAHEKLDAIEHRMEEVGVVLLRQTFRVGSPKFAPTAADGEALIALSKKASEINVTGHADNTGTAMLNRQIAMDRALSAKRFLIDHGVATNKVHVFSHGDDDPVGDNSTAVGRALNRRVDISFKRTASEDAVASYMK